MERVVLLAAVAFEDIAAGGGSGRGDERGGRRNTHGRVQLVQRTSRWACRIAAEGCVETGSKGSEVLRHEGAVRAEIGGNSRC